jgi:hypothetical protein
MRAVAVCAAGLLLLAGCASSTSSATTTAVIGRVLSGPSCPVERAANPCPPRPVDGADVEALQHGDVIAATHTDRDGNFRLQLRPGRYLIRATNVGALASRAQRIVSVDASGPAPVIRLVVDSGIR